MLLRSVVCPVLFLLLSAPANAGPETRRQQAPAPLSAAETRAHEARLRRSLLSGVKSWAIQLRFLDRAALAASPTDLVVIDHAPHPKKDIEIPFLTHEVSDLKSGPNNKRRLVLAYLSIGEAERYRFYWKPEWEVSGTKPTWLGSENPQWPGDFAVDYTNPEWQSTIFGTPESYLDRIVAAGFDGVYLDRADAFQDREPESKDARDAMVRFIARLSDHARRSKPQFLVVMQNAEELIDDAGLRQRLDGIAKEDLAYGSDNSAIENPAEMVRDSLQYLRKAKRAGLAVFTLEYVTEPHKRERVRSMAAREGFRLHITERLLGTLSIDREAGAAPPAEPAVH